MTTKKPNIVMIITDDHGYWALGSAGNKEIHTPYLDQIAQEGIRFENFFCASPVCSPARLSIFTGKIPSQHGVHDWIARGHASEEQLEEGLKAKLEDPQAGWEYNFPRNQLKGDEGIRFLEGHKCFTEVLQENGYTCGISGKWHMGDSGVPQAGFTYWQTIAMGGDNYYYPTVFKEGKFHMEREKYVTEYITEQAITFLDQEKESEQPFYLSVHYTAPHSPWDKEQHPAEIYKLYEACPFESVPHEPRHPWSIYNFETVEQEEAFRQKALKGYYTATTAMDQGVGAILKALEERNLLEDTIILFTGDNGMSMGHHGIFGKGNGTYPMNMYDTAVKVPMLMYYPKGMPKGVVNEDLLSHYDILPTLMDYLGVENSIDLEQLPGRSFAKVLEGQPLEQDGEVVIMDEYGPTRMIRTKEWKYIHRYPYGPYELYDLVGDPEEQNNLVEDPAYEKVKESLKDKLNQWYQRYVDPAVDGKGEAVTGNGQIARVGLYSQGKTSFL